MQADLLAMGSTDQMGAYFCGPVFEALDATGCAYNRVNFPNGQSTHLAELHTSIELNETTLAAAENLALYEHELPLYEAARHENFRFGAMRFSDRYSRDEIERLHVYRKAYRSWDGHHVMNFHARILGDAMASGSFWRKERDFSDDELHFVECLTQTFYARGRILELEAEMRHVLLAALEGERDLEGRLHFLADGLIIGTEGELIRLLVGCGIELTNGFRLPEALLFRLEASFEAGGSFEISPEAGPGVLAIVVGASSLYQNAREARLIWKRGITHDFSALSPREREVARWVAEGKTYREIGTILGISHRTVSKHVENILVKAELENRAALMLAKNSLV